MANCSAAINIGDPNFIEVAIFDFIFQRCLAGVSPYDSQSLALREILFFPSLSYGQWWPSPSDQWPSSGTQKRPTGRGMWPG